MILKDSYDEDDKQSLAQRNHEDSDIKVCLVFKNSQTVGMEWVTTALSQHDVRTFVGSQKFCDVSGPQFDTSSDVHTVGVFQMFFDKKLMHHKEESTKYVLQQTATGFTPFTLTKRIRKWKDKSGQNVYSSSTVHANRNITQTHISFRIIS
jgi:hypothetical protein